MAPPLVIEQSDGGGVFTDFHLGAAYEGPPGHVHGGVAALVLDHVLGAAASSQEKPRLTGTITLRYLRTTRLGNLHAEARITRTEGVKTFTADISPTKRASPSKPKACSSSRGGPATSQKPVACAHFSSLSGGSVLPWRSSSGWWAWLMSGGVVPSVQARRPVSVTLVW